MPFDRKRYPPNWTSISRRIRERAKQKCEQCGVANHAVGARDMHDAWHDETAIDGMNSTDGMYLFGADDPKIIRIVLTVAHLDHTPMNCADENLLALCQRCHNRLDAPVRARHAAETRRAKKHQGQLSLFADPDA